MVQRMQQDEPPTTYMTASGSSWRWGQAFSEGCHGRAIVSNSLRGGNFAAFLDPWLWPVYQEAKKRGLTYYYGDHAYFGRKNWFRITKNATQHDCQGESDGKRFGDLKIPIKPWRTGSKILLCPQSETFHNLHGHTQQHWVNECIASIKRHTKKPIEIRYKIAGTYTEKLFRESLRDVHAVVVFTSVAGVHASLEGVPCFATSECASAKFGSMDLSKIENPEKPENRYEMACVLADNQWTLEEIERGEAWEKLR